MKDLYFAATKKKRINKKRKLYKENIKEIILVIVRRPTKTQIVLPRCLITAVSPESEQSF